MSKSLGDNHGDHMVDTEDNLDDFLADDFIGDYNVIDKSFQN